jgi:hypothetical protein
MKERDERWKNRNLKEREAPERSQKVLRLL